MTPDQTALAQLLITGFAILLGPLAGVLFTFWFQNRKEQNDAKQRLFLVFMAHRKSNPPTFELVSGLNLIDVVFAEHREVVNLWHQYYDLLNQEPVNWHLAEAKMLDLLSAMARVLGFTELSQADIFRFYSPKSHGNKIQTSFEIQNELLRVLKNSAQVHVEKKDDPPA